MRGCRVFLADDKMQKGRSAAIIARYNASVFSFGASNDRSTRAFRLYMDMLILIRASCAPPSRPNPPPSCVGRQTCPHPRALTPGPSPQGPHPRALTPGPSPQGPHTRSPPPAADFIGNPASTFSGNIARVRAHSLGTGAASNILTTVAEKCLGVTRTGT
jgi:hypothetical protein